MIAYNWLCFYLIILIIMLSKETAISYYVKEHKTLMEHIMIVIDYKSLLI